MFRCRTCLPVLLFAALAVAIVPALGQGPSAADRDSVRENATVTGEVVDLWCFIDHKGHGSGHRSCALTCAKAGNPMGIVDDQGRIYVAMGSKKHQPGRDVLIQHMAETVTVHGTLRTVGGIKAIYVQNVESPGSGTDHRPGLDRPRPGIPPRRPTTRPGR